MPGQADQNTTQVFLTLGELCAEEARKNVGAYRNVRKQRGVE